MKLSVNKIYESKNLSVRNLIYYNLNNEFLFGDNGLLIDKEGRVVNNLEINHGFYNLYYIQNEHIIITDHCTSFAACSWSLGLCAIDLKACRYSWKHYYDYEGDNRKALKENKLDDINVTNLNKCYYNFGFFIIGKFKIDIISGEYTIMNLDKIESLYLLPLLETSVQMDKCSFSYNNEYKAFAPDRYEDFENKSLLLKDVYHQLREQGFLSEVKIYGAVDFYNNSILIVGQEWKSKLNVIYCINYIKE